MITTSVSTGRFVFTFKSTIPILYEATHYGSNHHFVKMFDFCTTWAVIGVFHNSQTVCFNDNESFMSEFVSVPLNSVNVKVHCS